MDTAYEIKKLRMDMKMNRKEFCEFFDIPYRTVSDWEAGKRHMPEYVFRLMEYRARMEYFNKTKKDKSLMSQREQEVLNMQLTLIPLLSKAWKKSYFELSLLFKKYDVLDYIDVCYEKYNSTGEQGIIEDLKDYVESQGGKID